MSQRMMMLCAAALVVVRAATWAQSFTFVAADTVLAAPLGSEMVFNCTFTNTSPSAITLFVLRTVNDLPQGWESSLCFNVCYPPTVDSIVSPLMNSGDTLAFSVHMYGSMNSGTGIVRIVARNTHNSSDQRTLTFHPSFTIVSVTDTRDPRGEFSLAQNFPNPFNPVTHIRFHIPASALTELKVYDVLGREVATLMNGVKEPGTYTVMWDGSAFVSGVYYYRMRACRTDGGQAGTFVETKKLLLLR